MLMLRTCHHVFSLGGASAKPPDEMNTSRCDGVTALRVGSASASSLPEMLRNGAAMMDCGARLRVQMRLVLDGAARDLYPCFRSGCKCSGIFYKDFFCAKSKLVAVVGFDVRGTSTPNDVDALNAHFKSQKVSLQLQYGDKLQSGCVRTCKWVPASASSTSQLRSAPLSNPASAWVSVGGEWHVTLRPKQLPLFGQLVNCVVTLGRLTSPYSPHSASPSSVVAKNSVTSNPFEIRTKPSEWLSFEGLPACWDTAKVSQFLRNPTGSEVCMPTPAALHVHLDGLVGTGYAFAKFSRRTTARDAMMAFTAAVSSLPSDTFAKGVVVSMIPSMNRIVPDDPTLAAVREPSCCARGRWAVQEATMAASPAASVHSVHSQFSIASDHVAKTAELPQVASPVPAPPATPMFEMPRLTGAKRAASDDSFSSDVSDISDAVLPVAPRPFKRQRVQAGSDGGLVLPVGLVSAPASTRFFSCGSVASSSSCESDSLPAGGDTWMQPTSASQHNLVAPTMDRSVSTGSLQFYLDTVAEDLDLEGLLCDTDMPAMTQTASWDLDLSSSMFSRSVSLASQAECAF